MIPGPSNLINVNPYPTRPVVDPIPTPTPPPWNCTAVTIPAVMFPFDAIVAEDPTITPPFAVTIPAAATLPFAYAVTPDPTDNDVVTVAASSTSKVSIWAVPSRISLGTLLNSIQDLLIHLHLVKYLHQQVDYHRLL